MSFKLNAPFQPAGDQPEAIKQLVSGLNAGMVDQVLLGATGTGKTFTMANVIQELNRPALIMAHNKTLAAQLYSEFKSFFPENAVEYFVSYYDYYQPEAYIAKTDTFIEKDSSINEQIDRLRHSATRALLERRDVIVISSVSCIYGLGSPELYLQMTLELEAGKDYDMRELMVKLVELQYTRNDSAFERGSFRVRGDVMDIFPSHYEDTAWRLNFFGDELETIYEFDSLTGERGEKLDGVTIFANSHHVTPRPTLIQAVGLIKEELKTRLNFFEGQNMLLERQRIEQRTKYDVEMIVEAGTCKGIENYSRYLSGRAKGQPPPTLFEYLPDDALLFVDESHVTVPQIRGMYNGDRARKTNLVEHGFRLPSALDNRPLKGEEWEEMRPQTIHVSATPSQWEMDKAKESWGFDGSSEFKVQSLEKKSLKDKKLLNSQLSTLTTIDSLPQGGSNFLAEKNTSYHSPLMGESDSGTESGGGENFKDWMVKTSRNLRKNMTDAEKKLWYFLQKKQMKGFKFRRQAPIDKYITDFLCNEAKIIIELDGGQHNEETSKIDDLKRDEFLKTEGFKVLRFWNNQVFEKLESVLESIWNELPDCESDFTPTLTLPHQGEGNSSFSSNHSPLIGESKLQSNFGGGEETRTDNQELITNIPPTESQSSSTPPQGGSKKSSDSPARGELNPQDNYNSQPYIAEQIIRPTGLLDPEVEIRPVTPVDKKHGQVDDIIAECREMAAQNLRVLITTLTKKTAENLSEYMRDAGLKVTYLHSDIDTLERVEIINDLRRGTVDILIGINLLREGIDIPECGLVGILDADKGGFLRSETSLIQTIGRAARNAKARVILYADVETVAMKAAISETNRRRAKQMAYNKQHNITPTTVLKEIKDDLKRDENEKSKRKKGGKSGDSTQEMSIDEIKKNMMKAAENLEFEEAARLRDILKKKEDQALGIATVAKPF